MHIFPDSCVEPIILCLASMARWRLLRPRWCSGDIENPNSLALPRSSVPFAIKHERDIAVLVFQTALVEEAIIVCWWRAPLIIRSIMLTVSARTKMAFLYLRIADELFVGALLTPVDEKHSIPGFSDSNITKCVCLYLLAEEPK